MPIVTVEDGSGLRDANSYISRADANTYFSTHLYPGAWATATDDNKDTALIMATRVLDNAVDWNGVRRTYEQALGWPRAAVYDRNAELLPHDVIPRRLKEAVAELATHLLGSDRTAERESIGIKSVKVDTIDIEFDRHDLKPVLPPSVVDMIDDFGSIKGTGFGSVKLVRS